MKQSMVIFLGLSAFVHFARADGPLLQCWGNNSQGQTDVPADVVLRTPPPKPADVKNANGKTCILDQNAKVSCWGIITPDILALEALENVKSFSIGDAGACAIGPNGLQCFDGYLSDGGSIEAVTTIADPIQVVVNNHSACAMSTTQVQCWGPGAFSSDIFTITDGTKLIYGEYNLCALSSDGSVSCWGDDTTKVNKVPAFLNASDIFMSSTSACAVTKSFLGKLELKCWGNANKDSTAPALPQPTVPTTYAAGNSHVCMLDSTGVHCVGDNTFNQLAVPALSHPTSISAHSRADATCAIDDTGVVCWGADAAGQSSLKPLSSLSAGSENTCVVNAGKLECWGSSILNQPIAAQDALQVVTGPDFACALNTEAVFSQACWGTNSVLTASRLSLPLFGQGNDPSLPAYITGGFAHVCLNEDGGTFCLGNNDFGQSTPPIGLSVQANPGMLSAGGYQSCAIDQNQGLECWGESSYGQLAVPTTLKNPRQVTVGFQHVCALDDNGVTCWGRSTEGQTLVPALKNPVSVQAGGYHTCAVDDDGLKCWGENSFGQSAVPLTVGKKVTNLSLGLFHTCAVAQ